MSRGRPGNAFDRLRPLRRILRPLEAAQVRVFGRSLLSVSFRTPVLLLHTTGRRSGRSRTTPLAYRDADGSFLVVGGSGGQTRIPDWVANLRADPVAEITVNRQRLPVSALELTGDERAARWAELMTVWPQIDTYERRSGREVPVFALRTVD